MNWKNVIASCLVLLVGLTLTYSAEKQVFSKQQLANIAKTREVGFLRIASNGDIVALATPTKGKKATIIVHNILSKQTKKILLPVSRVSHIAVDAAAQNAIFHEGEKREFWHVDLTSKKIHLLAESKKGTPGFGLYGGRRSHLSYVGENLYVWGYRHDEQMRFIDNYIFHIDPKGIFHADMKYKILKRFAKKHCPQVQSLGKIKIGSKYLVFGAFDKNKNGKLIAVHLKSKRSFAIAEFARLVGVELAKDNQKIAYIVQKKAKSPGELYVYDLSKKKEIKLAAGTLIHPIFNDTSDKIAFSEVIYKQGRKKISQNLLISEYSKKNSPKKYLLSPKKLYMDWKFTQDDKFLILFDGFAIYQLKL